MPTRIGGIMPVMLTPFHEDGRVDFVGLEKLTAWYLDHRADVLFAVAQSSEMQFLTVRERVDVTKCVLGACRRAVPVVASGHVADTIEDQAAEINEIANTGVDVVVLVTNRLDPGNDGTAAFRTNLEKLLKHLPDDLPLGLYECPSPYRRLLTDDELAFCRDTGRFVLLKDVSCNLDTVRRRAALVRGTSFAVINANAAIALEAMRQGSVGFAGVFTNFHPDLYSWLFANRNRTDQLVSELASFLALSAMAEAMGYPKLAKVYHQRLGTFPSAYSRSVTYDLHERHWALDVLLDHIDRGNERFRSRIERERTGQ